MLRNKFTFATMNNLDINKSATEEEFNGMETEV